MAQKNNDKDIDTGSKFSYQQFCKMLRRFYKEQEKKEQKHQSSHLGYKPMSEYKKIKPKQVRGK